MKMRSKFRGLKEIWQFDNRLSLILNRIFFPNENLNIYRYKGLEVLTDHFGGDANGAREVLTSPMYRRFLPRLKIYGPVNVLDLGGNNGGFPLLLLSSGWKLKKVVSVELNPKTFVRLNFNLCRNLDCDVLPINAAVNGNNGEIEIWLGSGSVSDSIVGNKAETNSQKYKIQGFSLDHFVDSHFDNEIIDICKIDIEGAEFDVFLQPFHKKIKQCRYLIMEIHERDGRRAGEIVPVVEQLGFTRQPLEPDADPSVHFFVNSTVHLDTNQ